ncbi:ExbD/TolR family protein [Nevskia soli]|uniref:ExbD/TolR family protein n=1 Tax=Nevskia soli TaxID=418856 RepID=UPI0004A707A9|nr:biopolymer transporter ExbD [Nevskia soli]
MAMQLGSPSEEDEVMSSINTTPLVDVMLVLLIIFLITIPVVTHTVPVQLPAERNQPTQTKPENIIIAVNRDGQVFWNERLVPDLPTLFERMKAIAVQVPQPEIHIRGDQEVRYRAVGEVVVTCQRAGIVKIAFITEPPPRG